VTPIGGAIRNMKNQKSNTLWSAIGSPTRGLPAANNRQASRFGAKDGATN